MPLLDKTLPEDVSPKVAERFQGFSQHCLASLDAWRQTIIKFSNRLSILTTLCSEVKAVAFAKEKAWPAGRFNGAVEAALAELVPVVCILEQFVRDFPEVKEAEAPLNTVKALVKKLTKIADSAPQFFVSEVRLESLRGHKVDTDISVKGIEACLALVSGRPVAQRLVHAREKVVRARELLSQSHNCNANTEAQLMVEQKSDRALFKTLLGLQAMLKNLNSFTEDQVWISVVSGIVSNIPKYKCLGLVKDLEDIVQVFNLVPEERQHTFSLLKDVVEMLDIYKSSLTSLLRSGMLMMREFSKLLSVLLLVFRQIAVQGFCPIKGFEDEEKQSGETDFKSSEEETGLGEGEGSKDVSDQIENEDMLDGAYDGKDKKEEEDKDVPEEDNGIEMSDNFDSQLQDKKDEPGDNDEDKEGRDEEKDLDDEVGEVEGNEELDKEMWGDQEEEEEDDDKLGQSDEQGKTEEEQSEDLSSNDKQDSKQEGEKRERKEEEEQEPEFDDNQVDAIHGEDNKFPEPEPMELPNEMEMEVDDQEDQFEEHEADNEPEAQPDFEEEADADKDGDDEEGSENENDDAEDTQVEKFEPDDEPTEEGLEKAEDDQTVKIDEEEKEDEGPDETMADEAKAGKDSVKNETEFDQSNKEESAGLNEDSNSQKDNKSFSVVSDKTKPEESEDKSGRGTKSEEQKSLADDTMKGERLELLEGNMTGEEGQKNAETFQHVMDQREEDKAALDRAEEDVKDQVFNNDFDMETEENEDDVTKVEERKNDKSKTETVEGGGEAEEDEKSKQDRADKEADKEFIETSLVARGTDSISVRQDMEALPAGLSATADFSTDLSLQQITLVDSEENTAPVLTQLSHQLSEQLRLILNPTKASSLQGDFRTGKRLNMRKIIPFIASDFKKDKIWMRRTKPNKREFQILVALDDSASMADNKTRQIALESLNTISSALALLEAGQIGVVRFGQSAEVIHPLNQQWSQAAGHKIQNQFKLVLYFMLLFLS